MSPTQGNGIVDNVLGWFKSRDQYHQISFEEAGSRVALTEGLSLRGTEEGQGLLEEEEETAEFAPSPKPRRSRRCSSCILCCKISGIVFGLISLYAAYRLIHWALTDPPPFVKGMPVFSKSLGCSMTPYVYNNTEITISIPLGSKMEHAAEIQGGGVGTVIIAEAPADATEMVYKISIKSDDEAFLNQVGIIYPSRDDTTANSRLIVRTPQAGVDEKKCSRFAITAYVPRNLKKFALASHSVTHVQFDHDANFEKDRFSVTLYKTSTLNMILPHPRIRADRLQLEVFRGWIVGDVSLLNTTAISTQRGDGVMNIRVIPTMDDQLRPVFIQTTSGAGRTDFFYINEQHPQHRPIRAVHMSSRSADMYIHYNNANFDGLIELKSKSYTTRGVHAISDGDIIPDVPNPGSGKPPAWTHAHGDVKGGDKMMMHSKGWTGLYM